MSTKDKEENVYDFLKSYANVERASIVKKFLESIKQTDNVEKVFLQVFDVPYEKINLVFVVGAPVDSSLSDPNYSVGYNDYFNENNLEEHIELKVVRADNLEKGETSYYRALKLTLEMTGKLLWEM